MGSDNDQPYEGGERRRSVFTDHDLLVLSNLIRSSKQESQRKVFGVTISEFAMIVSAALMVVTFYVRTNDLALGFKDFKSYTQTFMDNSDRYHTTVLGVGFKQGTPENPNFNAAKVREMFNGK